MGDGSRGEKSNIRWGLREKQEREEEEEEEGEGESIYKRSVFTKCAGGITMMDERVIIKQNVYYSSGGNSGTLGKALIYKTMLFHPNI